MKFRTVRLFNPNPVLTKATVVMRIFEDGDRFSRDGDTMVRLVLILKYKVRLPAMRAVLVSFYDSRGPGFKSRCLQCF